MTVEQIDVMIFKFEEMITEIEKIQLAENLKYAIRLQFLKRFKNSGKIDTVDKMIMRDVLEDVNGNPRDGGIIELMKKELRKLKVVDSRAEPFKQEDKTFYVKDDNRARLDKWRNEMQAKGFVNSGSNPRLFRTASRNNYVRERLNFGRRNSRQRQNSTNRVGNN